MEKVFCSTAGGVEPRNLAYTRPLSSNAPPSMAVTLAGMVMLVSAGLGEHTIPLRLWNPRELVVADIKGKR